MFSFLRVNLSRFVPFIVMLQKPSLHLRICEGLVMLWTAKLFTTLNIFVLGKRDMYNLCWYFGGFSVPIPVLCLLIWVRKLVVGSI